MNQELYCKIFIDGDEPLEELYDAVNSYLQGEKQGFRTIRTNVMELDLKANEEYAAGSEDFLYWRYYADIETRTDSKEEYVDSIKSLLQFFRSKHILAVAACQFEDELISE